jgi:casein kinase 1
MQLDPPRAILGDRTTVVNTDAGRPKSKDSSGKKSAPATKPKATAPPVVIEVSDSEDEETATQPTAGSKIPAADASRLPKAVQLRQVSLDIAKAGDTLALAHSAEAFVRILRDTRARSLTREGFMVLEALSIALVGTGASRTQPLRRARTRETDGGNGPRGAKASRLIDLRRNVAQVSDRRALAEMVREFGRITDASNGRTITKDGLAFLDGVVGSLKALA